MLNPDRDGVIGRAGPVADLDRWLASPEPDHQVIVVRGPVGIGKTRFVDAARTAAEAHGLTVIHAAPGEREADFPYSALADLVEAIPTDARLDLPEPQRAALEAVTMQRSGPLTDTQRHAAARGFLTALRATANGGRVVVLLDDAQWLDAPSADVITFVLKRAPVTLVVAQQSASGRDPLRLAALGSRVRVRHIVLEALSPLEIGELVASKLGVNLTRLQVRRLHTASGGNPLYALEIARSDPTVTVLDGEASGSHLAELFRGRIAALQPETRRLCLLVALAATPSVAVLDSVGYGEDDITVAIEAQVLLRDQQRLRFTSPVLGTTLTHVATPAELVAAHTALAASATTDHQKAYHLAHSVTEPDLAAATAVAIGAREAAERHGPEAAAPLYEAASQLLPADDAETRFAYRAEAASQYVAAGDPGRARAILEDLVAGAAPGPQRAEGVWRWADTLPAPIPELASRCETALADAESAPRLKARLLLQLTTFAWLQTDYRRAAETSTEAVRVAEDSGNPVLLASSLAERGTARSLLGRGHPEPELAPAVAIEDQVIDQFPAYLRPRYRLGILRMRFDDLQRSRQDLIDELETVESLADDATRVGVLVRLAEFSWRSGEWGRALERADEARALAATASIEQEHSAALAVSALINGSIGNIDAARRLAHEATNLAERGGFSIIDLRAAGALIAAELSAGKLDEAAAVADRAMPVLYQSGLVELSDYPVIDSAVEAYVGVGRLDDAYRAADLVDQRTFPEGRLWHVGVSARSRGLIHAAEGNTGAARKALDVAITAHRDLGRPFPLARTLYVAGTVKRRTRAKGEARRHLTDALEFFDHLGAGAWSERTASELAIVGSGSSGSTLTPAESRVAELVADGYSNKEVAATLFVAVRTVETHLSSIYRKLGIRSRVELARSYPPETP